MSNTNQLVGRVSGGLPCGWTHWNKAKIDPIDFVEVGQHLLRFRYHEGNNFACFEFAPGDP